MTEAILCPFSKPIIGNYCACPHARLAERCSGKMVRELLTAAVSRYGSITAFPFSEIMRDIQEFNHRRKKKNTI